MSRPLPGSEVGTEPHSVVIVKHKIADFVDPPRFIPLIGKAQLHHAHYKCNILYTERSPSRSSSERDQQTAEVVEVVYIDHRHLHLASDIGD